MRILFFFLSLACTQLLCQDKKQVIIFEDTFQRVRDSNTPSNPKQPFTLTGRQKITINYNLSQHSLIENNQMNTMTASSITPHIDTAQPTQPTLYEQLYNRVGEHLWNPLALGAVAFIGYLFYCAKTKLSLYSLGKACIEKAVWSLWKTKLTDDLDEENTEAALLIQILQTYNTDNYTQAVARFLHDVEEEIDVLTAYINEAQSVQNGLLRFMFKDMSTAIKEAQERLDKLLHIKTVVMAWLHRQQWEN